MSTQPKSYITPEEYLEIERKAQFKSEYFDGQMYAMSGAIRAHILIVGNLQAALWQRLEQSPCEIYTNEMRVQVGRNYVYPDLAVACGQINLLKEHFDTLLNPVLVVEVLSTSTEGYVRIPRDGDQHSEVMSITIPK